MNDLSEQCEIGTAGELLVQLRLLQFGVQAAPPLKDSGNDLIGVRHNVFRAIQVKTTKQDRYRKNKLPENYHLLAVVKLRIDGVFRLDESDVYLIPKEEVKHASTSINKLGNHRLSAALIDKLFANPD
jgi:hypothetical protein